MNGEERRLAGCDARMLGRHEPIAVDDRVRVVSAERLALGLTDTMDAAPRARWLLDNTATAPAGYANTRAGF